MDQEHLPIEFHKEQLRRALEGLRDMLLTMNQYPQESVLKVAQKEAEEAIYHFKKLWPDKEPGVYSK